MTEAAKLVAGERQAMYGAPEDNWRRIAALQDAWVKERIRDIAAEVVKTFDEVEFLDSLLEFAIIEPPNVADLNILQKLARDMGPGDCPDNMLDVQGYAEIKRRLKYPTKSR